MGLRTYKAKSWSTGIWQHQSTELHDTGCRKSSVSSSSQEQSLYSLLICARLWKKERLKRTTSWSAYYYTSRGLWYLFEIPSIPLPSAIKATQDEISMMQEWARAHRSSVQQRSVRQKTTMARAGTLRDYLYQNEIQVGEKNQSSVK